MTQKPKKIEIEIKEDLEELKRLKKHENDARKRDRIWLLIELKEKKEKKLIKIIKKIEREASTIYEWIKEYEEKGFEEYIKETDYNRHKSKLNGENLEKLKNKLNKENEGFASFIEIHEYVKNELNVDLSYESVRRIVTEKLKAKLKIVRPVNENKDPKKEEVFKKNYLKQ